MLAPDGVVTAAGRDWAAVVPDGVENVVGTSVLDVVATEHRDTLARALQEAMAGTATVVDVTVTRDGAHAWRGTLAPFPTADEATGAALFLRPATGGDTTRSRMIGRATRTIGHDLNNLLTIIVGLNGLLMENVSSERVPLYTAEIAKAAERAARLADELVALGRRPEAATLINVNGLLLELRPLLVRLAGAATLELELDPAVPPVTAERSAIVTLLIELMACAASTIGVTGRVCLETLVPLSQQQRESDHHCTIRLEVRGAVGMPDEALLDGVRHASAACNGTVEVRRPGAEFIVEVRLPRGEYIPMATTQP